MTFAVYCDVREFVTKQIVNQETASLIGGNSILSGAVSAGATSLSVASGTGYVANDDVWILDGPASERVTCTAVSGTTLTVTATAAAHAAGANVASAGSAGCLAAALEDASREVENICRQGPDGAADRSLYAKARTETHTAPYGRAAFDTDGTLIIRPYFTPVSSVAGITVQVRASTPPLSLNLTALVLAEGGRIIEVPQATLATQPYGFYTPRGAFSRSTDTYIALTYTGGPVTAATIPALPGDIRHACALLAADILAARQNPYGFAQVRRGDVSFEAKLRGDVTGKSMLYIDAERRLQPYTRKS